MTTVLAPSPPAATKPAAPAAAQGPAAPLALRAPALAPRVDFRSLLRPQTSGGELSPRAALTSPAPSPRAGALPAVHAPAPNMPPRSAAAAVAQAAHRDGERDRGDPLDRLARHHASLGPPGALFSVHAPLLQTPPMQPAATPPGEAPVARAAAASLEDLLPALVRRVAWSGDGHRGTMRLELGAGELAGATLLVHAEGGRVRVELAVPPGVSAGHWQERIRERLQARNIPTDSVEVT